MRTLAVVAMLLCSARADGPLQQSAVMDQKGNFIMTWTPYEHDVVIEVTVSIVEESKWFNRLLEDGRMCLFQFPINTQNLSYMARKMLP